MPFVATSPEQIRVGDEVEANNADGEIVRGLVHEVAMRPGRSERAMIKFGKKCRMWYFDPSVALGFTRTWTVLNRDLEPERPEIRVGDRVELVRRREGVVSEVGNSYVRFGDGAVYIAAEHLTDDWGGWAQTIEILERAPEPLTPEQKLEKIKALLEEDSEGTEVGISCGGYKITDDGCFVATLAAKIAAILEES